MSSKADFKVAHLIDQASGGAAVAAKRLAAALTALGVKNEIWALGRRQKSENEKLRWLEDGCPPSPLERIIKNFSKPLGRRFRRERQRTALLRALWRDKPDILHLHNLHASALQHEDLALIPRDLRVVWTMHDCWPWAPYAYRWRNETGVEETQGAEPRPESAAERARTDFFLSRPGTVLVGPSEWITREAQAGTPSKICAEWIPNSIPLDIFKPMPKAQAKTKLGFDHSKIWIGLSAASFDRRKGADIIIDALGIVNRKDLGIVIWGDENSIPVPQGVSVFRSDYVSNEHRQSIIYSACDLFVCPSRIDNLPNTVLESMACSTPVAGSAVGGIPEMVRPRETGWLYENNCPSAFAQTLEDALSEKSSWPAHGDCCRSVAEAEFSQGLQASRYRKVYEDQLL
jgi:glycosyltransferase involved in cell wall biosynthesis